MLEFGTISGSLRIHSREPARHEIHNHTRYMDHSFHPAMLHALLRRDFATFLAETFGRLNPGSAYLPNWHIELLGEYLGAVQRGEVRRLVINVPPRSLKSLCVTVAWPAWMLGHAPQARIIAASHSAALSAKHAQECRLILQSPAFRQVFPKTTLCPGENQKEKFVTTARGGRLSSSVLSSITGEGGDFIIVDDPLTPLQAMSARTRKLVNDWFEQTLFTRLDNKNTGAMVVVMQRLHESDLSGHLLQAGGWEHLCLPAIAPERRIYRFGHIHKTVEEGELLHPARERTDTLEAARKMLGSAAFAAQYLQEPYPEHGNMIRREWLRRYLAPPAQPIRCVQSWDTGIKAGPHNDASVCLTFIEAAEGHYLVDAQRRRVEYPELRRFFVERAEAFKPDAILIEDRASGQQLLQDMRKESGYHLIPILPRLDKVTRLAGISALIEAGKLFLPGQARWLAEFEQELLRFPSCEHDDYVDALTQYFQWQRRVGWRKPGIRMI